MKRNTNLNKLRNSINLIDEEMAKLFAFRLDLVVKIAQEKKDKNLNIEDVSREQAIINKNKEFLSNPEYLPLYEELMNKIFELSKKLQSNLITNDEVD